MSVVSVLIWHSQTSQRGIPLWVWCLFYFNHLWLKSFWQRFWDRSSKQSQPVDETHLRPHPEILKRDCRTDWMCSCWLVTVTKKDPTDYRDVGLSGLKWRWFYSNTEICHDLILSTMFSDSSNLRLSLSIEHSQRACLWQEELPQRMILQPSPCLLAQTIYWTSSEPFAQINIKLHVFEEFPFSSTDIRNTRLAFLNSQYI